MKKQKEKLSNNKKKRNWAFLLVACWNCEKIHEIDEKQKDFICPVCGEEYWKKEMFNKV